MARIEFTPMIAELVGKLAGSVFQYSYGGYQIHTRVSPANPETPRQQLRRGWFGWFAASWKNLSGAEQASFITAAGSAPEGFRLYIQANINCFLIDEPEVTTYVGTTAPDSFPVDIDTYTAGDLQIIASSALDTVPAGQKLLIFSTYEKKLPKRFTNPSEFSPIVYFDEGTDMSTATNITADYQALYGVLVGAQRVCINAVLIEKSNGNRSADSIVCMPPVTTETFRVIDDSGDSLVDADGTFIVYQ